MTIASGSLALASDILKSLNASGYLDLTNSTVLTIASGAVTQATNFHRIAGEGGADDTLDTITLGSGFGDGAILFLRPSSDSVTITIGHDTGNISCVGSANLTLDEDHDLVICIYDANLSKWIAMGGMLSDICRQVHISFNDTASSTYNTYPTFAEYTSQEQRVKINFSKFPTSATVKLACSMATQSDTGYVHLYNVTDTAVITGSELSTTTTGSVYEYKETSDIRANLPSGEKTFTLRGAGGGIVTIRNARLIITW